jgi:probable phosphoglycerate mutase
VAPSWLAVAQKYNAGPQNQQPPALPATAKEVSALLVLTPCQGVGCLQSRKKKRRSANTNGAYQYAQDSRHWCSREIIVLLLLFCGDTNLESFRVRCWHRSLAHSAQMIEPNSVLVFCVRHGETSWNEAGLLQGQTDIPLNDRGRQQARQAGVFLAQRHQLHSFAGYVSSDLSRAFETASLIMAAMPIGGSPQTDKRLRETHMGRWQGKTWEDVTTDPDDRVASDKWRRDPDFPVPGEGGESFRVRFSRVAAATHAAALHAAAGALADRSATGETTSAESSASLDAASTPSTSPARVLLVSHGGVLDDVARLVKKVRPHVASQLWRLTTCWHFEADSHVIELNKLSWRRAWPCHARMARRNLREQLLYAHAMKQERSKPLTHTSNAPFPLPRVGPVRARH